MANKTTPMDVKFVNKYDVSKEGQAQFFVTPKQREATPHQRHGASSTVGDKVRRWNGWIRILGLCLAVLIIVMAVLSGMWALAIVGGILVAMYVIRIYQAHLQDKEREERAVPPPSPQYSNTGKWVRYIRFGPHIEQEDPGQTQTFQYDQIVRISDDPAYLTLWMDDDRQVRVLKKGFIIGHEDGFKQFIMTKTGRLIGPATIDSSRSEGPQARTQSAQPDTENTSGDKKPQLKDSAHHPTDSPNA